MAPIGAAGEILLLTRHERIAAMSNDAIAMMAIAIIITALVVAKVLR